MRGPSGALRVARAALAGVAAATLLALACGKDSPVSPTRGASIGVRLVFPAEQGGAAKEGAGAALAAPAAIEAIRISAFQRLRSGALQLSVTKDVPIAEGDTRFRATLELPTAAAYHIVAEARGVRGQGAQATEFGALYGGEGAVDSVFVRSGHVVEIAMENLVPDLAVAAQSGRSYRLLWSPVAEAVQYRVRDVSAQNGGPDIVTASLAADFVLPPGLDHQPAYRVRAELPQDFVGAFSARTVVRGLSPSALPPILDLAVTATELTSVGLRWSAPGSAGAEPADSYELRYSTTPITEAGWASATLVTGVPKPLAPGSEERFTVTSLSEGVTYYFAVRYTYELSALSPISNVVSATTGRLGPGTPIALEAVALSESEITLTWQSAGTDEDFFDIQRRASGGLYTLVASVPRATTGSQSYPNVGLASRTSYTYRVRARNSVGLSGFSNEASARTWIAPPRDLAAKPASASAIRLTWVFDGADPNGFRLERIAPGGLPLIVFELGGSARQYEDRGLLAGTMYSYRVLAFDDQSVSRYSNTASAVTGGDPICAVDPAELAFGTVALGSARELSFTIRNAGAGVLNASPSEACDEFAIVAGGGEIALGAGQSRTVTVRYTPAEVGPTSCTLSIGGICEQVVAASGVALAPPICCVEPTSLAFGPVLVGSSKDLSFVITNSTAAVVRGTVAELCGEFSIVSGGGAFELGAAGQHTVVVRYQPRDVATHSCEVDLGGVFAPVPVEGSGVTSALCGLDVTRLDFGVVPRGLSGEQSFIVSNFAGGTLAGEARVECAAFSIIAGGGPFELAPGATRIVTIRYQPLGAGPDSTLIALGPLFGDVLAFGSGIVPPSCTLSQQVIDFGTVPMGTANERTLTITNSGGGIVSGVASLGAGCDEFEIVSGAGAFTLGPGATHDVVIRYEPLDAGADTCDVELGTTCAGARLIARSGAPLPPDCAVSPPALTFGPVAVGSSLSLSFTITNDSDAPIAGSVSESCAEFSITAGAGAFNLLPGTSRNVTVRYAPTNGGGDVCSIALGTACGPLQASGSGVVSVSPACFVDPTSLSFGVFPVGGFANRSFTITNVGGGTLAGTIAASCGEFAVVSGGGSYALAAGASRTVTVRYTPAGAGGDACALDVGGLCGLVNLSGTALSAPGPVCSVDPASLGFGSVPMGGSSERMLTITNVGTGTLAGTVLESCAEFEIVSGGGSYELGSGAAREVTIRYTPADNGNDACVIGTGASCANVPSNGSGFGFPVPICSVFPSALDFGEITVGDSLDKSFAITNIGGAILSGVVAPACGEFIVVSGGGPYNLANGDTAFVVVRYKPQNGGADACGLDAGASCGAVACSGSGAVPICTLTPGAVSFGVANVGNSLQRRFVIRNVGAGVFSGFVSEGCAEFSILAGAGAYSLAAGESLAVTLAYAPANSGADTCAIALGSVLCPEIIATGASVGGPGPKCFVSPDTLSFGAVPIGTSADQVFVVTNIGGGVLNGSVTEACSEFEIITGAGPFSLAGGLSRNVTIRYAPADVVADTCAIDLGTGCKDAIGLGTGF